MRPPKFTLFPYTTLFRSFVSGHVLAAKLSDHRRTIRPDAVEFIDSGFGAFLEKRDRRGPFRIRAKPSPRKRDRKSTRLNSSHTVISYAVFCLKKKINIID